MSASPYLHPKLSKIASIERDRDVRYEISYRIRHGLVTYPFSDFGTGWTLPKLVLSGRVNEIIDAWWHSSLPSPFRTYPKENPVLLGREYLNRANHSVDILTSEQNNYN
ncbi:unnamed protein product [Brassica oleracea var. botrytis]